MLTRIFTTITMFVILCLASAGSAQPPRPNLVIIYVDDLGYSDVGCYGSPLIRTPRIDQLAREGMRFTDAYSPAPVCTPSRAGLLTATHPQRLGLMQLPNETPRGGVGRVLYANSRHGLHPEEITLAELLRAHGYATMCVGKWHLGDAEPFLPTRQGFDHYFGMPNSNDMKPEIVMRDEQVVENPADADTLLERYTHESLEFIRRSNDQPFLLYLAHNMPHTPLTISERFRGRSARGLYGDVVEAIDWSVGEILDELARLGLDDRTIVIFTSDNGPWHARGEQGGHANPLRGAKGTTYEGGMRVPFIVRHPRQIPAGSECREPITQMDIMPTMAAIIGAAMPSDRVIDGRDIGPLLRGELDAKSPHERLVYYGDGRLNAVRSGQWKFKLPTTLQEETLYGRYEQPNAVVPLALYDLHLDPGEQKNVAADHPEIVERLTAYAEQARQDIGDERSGTVGQNTRPVGRIDRRD